MSFLGGHLLVASPYLADRNFFRSVVLIVSHDDEHAFGLLLNRPGHQSLNDVWRDLSGDVCERSEMIRSGGPLAGPLMVLHRLRQFSDTQIVSDVYLSTIQDSMAPIIDTEQTPMIPVMGYSGWEAGQLERELEVGGWMTVPATADVVFASPEEQWEIASRQVSDRIFAGVELRHVPQDPRWN